MLPSPRPPIPTPTPFPTRPPTDPQHGGCFQDGDLRDHEEEEKTPTLLAPEPAPLARRGSNSEELGRLALALQELNASPLKEEAPPAKRPGYGRRMSLAMEDMASLQAACGLFTTNTRYIYI